MSRARTPPTLDPALLLDSVGASPSLVFWVRDVEGRYTTVSRGFCELLGVEEEACIGRTASEFMPPEIAAFGEEVYRRVVASGEPSATEETHVIGGLERHFMVHRVPVRDRDRTRNLDGQALRRALAVPPRGPATLPPDREPLHGVLIEVSDTGHGMPPDVVSQAIEPFFTTKGRGRGTGLGLSVSYGIVQQHHGNLVIESAVGAGTTVRVFLPAMDVTPSRVSRPACVQPVSRTPTRFHHGPALVVEDDPPIRGLVASMLGGLGIEARTAANGSEAIEVLSSDEAGIRLVITDVAMPGMSGLMLARGIREVRPDVPVVFMSGCSDATLEQVGLTDDDILLRKPFTLEDLLSGIEAAVSRNS